MGRRLCNDRCCDTADTARTCRTLARTWHRNNWTDRKYAGQSLWLAGWFSTVGHLNCVLGHGWVWIGVDWNTEDTYQRGYGSKRAYDCALGCNSGQPT